MGGVLKVVLAVVAAVVLAGAVVVGYGVYQLNRLYPDAEGGRDLGAQIESELGTAHPGFTVDTAAHSSFAEVVVTIHPDDGELTEPEVSDLLESLQELTTEHAGSRWSLRISLEGRWEGTPVVITGSAADRWPELSPVLEVPGGSRAELTVALDTGRANIARDVGTERLCGPGTDPRDFFTDTLGEASDVLSELGWVTAEDPVLHYVARGCDPALRTALDLSGEDRTGRVEDLQDILHSLPDDQELTGLLVEPSGDLLMALDDVPDALATSLAQSWPHGQVWLNGELADSPEEGAAP